MKSLGLGATLQDAATQAAVWGPGCHIARGETPDTPDVFAPSGLTLSEQETRFALRASGTKIHFAFGNQADPANLDSIAPHLDLLIERSGIGFMTASFASPAQGRTVYQGHLFQDGKHIANLREALTVRLSGRVALIPHDSIGAGPTVIRRRIAACREQGVALALLDAVDMPACAAIAQALRDELLTGGPAWLAESPSQPEPKPQEGRIAILSGALDRQTLYQLGAARGRVPLLYLDFTAPEPAASALAWAAAQDAPKIIIAASAPPDRLHKGAPAARILGQIATGLKAAGTSNFVLTGNDTATAILDALGVQSLTAGAACAGLRWLNAGRYSFLLKPAGFGERNLFLDGIEPQLRLNAAAE